MLQLYRKAFQVKIFFRAVFYFYNFFLTIEITNTLYQTQSINKKNASQKYFEHGIKFSTGLLDLE